MPVKAYHCFTRARDHVVDDIELALVHEGIADSIDLIISFNRNRLRQTPRTPEKSSYISQVETAIEELGKEHKNNIDNAIRLWRGIDPRTRSEFARIHLKVFDLLSKKDDPKSLKTAKKTLSEAVISDEEYRDFPIYLLLGYVNLKLAYNPDTPADKREKYIKEVETSFQKGFSFNFNEKTEKFAFIADWDISE